MPEAAGRLQFRRAVRQASGGVVDIARALVAVPSPYPPGDTGPVAERLCALLDGVPGIEIGRHRSAPHVLNLVVRVRGHAPGRRLVLNGHLDTFPLDNPASWTADPAGEVRDGRLYGLGIADMKGGIAASVFALRMLAMDRSLFIGEAVGTFVGDEESMGSLGTQYLLETVPEARGDAMISADAGSPRVLRFGEKGMLWLRIAAQGRSAHAAHVHRGDSAIERLTEFMRQLTRLRRWGVQMPEPIRRAIEAAAPISEALSGAGETEVLRSVTVTFGTMHGGRLPNLIADTAEATVDIRVPVGTTVAEIEAEIGRMADADGQMSVEILRSYEPSWTQPDHEVVRIVGHSCRTVLGIEPVATMRVGASDARLYRPAGVPSVVCGLTPNNMGSADEFVELSELTALAEILSLSALEYLND